MQKSHRTAILLARGLGLRRVHIQAGKHHPKLVGEIYGERIVMPIAGHGNADRQRNYLRPKLRKIVVQQINANCGSGPQSGGKS